MLKKYYTGVKVWVHFLSIQLLIWECSYICRKIAPFHYNIEYDSFLCGPGDVYVNVKREMQSAFEAEGCL